MNKKNTRKTGHAERTPLRSAMRPAALGLALLLALTTGPARAQSPQTAFEYDAVGNRTKRTDPLSHVTGHTYDALDRLTQSTDAAGGQVRYQYDALGRVTQVTDPRGLATTYRYNAFGEATQVVSPDTGTATYTYDEAGNLKSATDARGVTATYTYDAANRLTQATYGGAGLAPVNHSYSYDQGLNGSGRLTGTSYAEGNTAWQYDPQGRITRKTQSLNTVLTVQYAYSGGRLAQITYPSGRQLTYMRNGAGQIEAIQIGGVSVLTSARYFPFGPVAGWSWGNGLPYSRGFDAEGRLQSYPLGGTLRELQYDAASRITAARHPSAPYADQGYGYDALDRLTGFTASTTSQGYTYDATGNRTSLTIGATPYPYTVAAASNRLTAAAGPAPAKSYGYDAAGRIVSDGSRSFSYDAAGRLLTFSGAPMPGALWGYDAFGQRVVKRWAGVTYYLYDEAGRLLGEYDGAGAAQVEYVWLGDTPVALLRREGESLVLYYIQADHLNTPRVVTDTQSNLRWRWLSDPFGMLPPEENPAGLGTFTFNLRFPGQYYDQETGLHYNMARYYDPQTGRYFQSDPIGLAGGINTYAYVNNAPTMYIDPLGLFAFGLPSFGLRYGNWGGASWSGGKYGPQIPKNPDPPIDPMDACFQEHDQCYSSYESSCMAQGDKDRSKQQCDGRLLYCLDQLGPDPDYFCASNPTWCKLVRWGARKAFAR